MNGVPERVPDRGADLSQAPATTVRWRILAILFAYSFMSWFNRVSMAVARDLVIMKEYKLSETQAGAVDSAFLFPYAIFMTPGGWFVDRFGPWKALVWMGFGSALFGALTGMLGWFIFSGGLLWLGLMGIRALMGICTTPIYPASGQVIARWFPFPQQAFCNGLVIGAALVGVSSTFYGFGSLVDWLGWQTAFVITGAVTALLGLLWTTYATNRPGQHGSVNAAEIRLIAAGQPNPAPGQATSAAGTEAAGAYPIELPDLAKTYVPPAAHWGSLLRNRSLVLLTCTYAAVGYFEYLFYFWIHHYFEKVLQFTEDDSRLASTIANSAMAVGMFLGGWLADRAIRKLGHRLGRAIVPVAGMTVSAAFLTLGFLSEQPQWVVVWFSLAMAAVGASEGPVWATAIELGGRRGGTSAGIVNTGGNVAGALSPVITPAVGVTFGWDYAMALASVICLVGAVLWFWIDPAERCPEDV
jgi:ACS family glucarate transporter-like MFS transporter